jgi:hypothetical protein
MKVKFFSVHYVKKYRASRDTAALILTSALEEGV